MKSLLVVLFAVFSLNANANSVIRLIEPQNIASVMHTIEVRVNGEVVPKACGPETWSANMGKCDITVPHGVNTITTTWKSETYTIKAPLEHSKRYTFLVGIVSSESVAGAIALDLEILGQEITNGENARSIAVLTSIKNIK